MKNRSPGFTLVELMIVLPLAAAMLVIGVPAFTNIQENGRLPHTANDMHIFGICVQVNDSVRTYWRRDVDLAP